MLELRSVTAGYDAHAPVLYDIALSVEAGETLCLTGPNGAGKTTIFKAILQFLPICNGEILLDGKDIRSLATYEIARLGVRYVPQGRRVFSGMTVAENLAISQRLHNDPILLDWILDRLPQLGQRLDQQASTLSGGEQQMLACACALCTRPRLLILDEPTEGLHASVIERILETICILKRQGMAVLLANQQVDIINSAADRILFIKNGRSPTT